MLRIKSKNVYINESFQKASIIIDGTKIVKIDSYDEKSDIDYGDHKILPGLVDIHCHGYQGFDCNKADEEGLIRWIKDLPKEGCTSFLVSSSTAGEDDLIASFQLFRKMIENPIHGAQIVGIHVEGPFISFSKAGAQNKYEIKRCDPKILKKWYEVSGKNIRLCCVAPEMDLNYELTEWCCKNDIVVSIGHTDSSYEVASDAIKHGAKSFTHTYNAMTQLNSRVPGVVGAALDHDDCYAELIADGVHVHPAAARILAKMKGKDHLIIVTDSTAFKGMKPGIYQKNDVTKVVVHEDGSIRLENGVLSGSGNCLNKLLKNAIEKMHIDEITAINAMTKNPCSLLNIKNKGIIAEGYDADIVVLNQDYEVIQTYCLGRKMV